MLQSSFDGVIWRSSGVVWWWVIAIKLTNAISVNILQEHLDVIEHGQLGQTKLWWEEDLHDND